MENNTNQLNSMLCKRNCGFFGNAACDGYCSKCYKEHVKRQNSGSAAGRVTPTGLSSISQSSIDIPVNSTVSVSATTANSTACSVSGSSPLATIGESSIAGTSPIAATTSSASTTMAPPAPLVATSSASAASTSSSAASVPIAIPSRQASCEAACSDELSMGGMSSSSAAAAGDSLAASMPASSLDDSALGSSMGTSVGSEKKKRSRCVLDSCKRKVGLTGFDCRCGGLYCWEHRYSDKHDCTFDYKELGQDQIRKNNPIVIGEKIQKI